MIFVGLKKYVRLKKEKKSNGQIEFKSFFLLPETQETLLYKPEIQITVVKKRASVYLVCLNLMMEKNTKVLQVKKQLQIY